MGRNLQAWSSGPLSDHSHALSSRTSPVPPHVGHSIMICSGTAGPGELSRDRIFPVPPQSGQGVVLGSSSIGDTGEQPDTERGTPFPRCPVGQNSRTMLDAQGIPDQDGTSYR
jgi:hypothetical protein